MSLSQRLSEYVRTAFTGIWIESHEHDDCLAEVGRLCHEQHWPLAVWDVERGLTVSGQATAGTADPLAAIRSVAAMAQPDSSALLVLVNFHRFLPSTEIVQALARQIQLGKTARTFVLVLSPVVQIPIELEKHFVVLAHDLPDQDQLRKIALGIATEEGEMPQGEAADRLLDAAAGLTRYEAEGAFSCSLVRHGTLRPEAVWELKSGMLRKGGLLSLYRGGETFADFGGLAALKGFCTKALHRSGERIARPRGILLLGVPGTGKSCFASSLGNETGRPTVVLDVGALLGGIVGETESRTRQALAAIDAMAPCVCFIDEVEKALSGSSGQTDSGVGARLFASLLGWLSDHDSDVFVVCTSNDISRLPPEFARSERFDAIWFLDLPGAGEKQKIWDQYLKTFALTKQPLPKDTDWTGAEIRSCCRLASLLDVTLLEAAKHVVPVAVTAAESVTKLRGWAAGRCLDASVGGIYARGAADPKLPGASAGRRPTDRRFRRRQSVALSLTSIPNKEFTMPATLDCHAEPAAAEPATADSTSAPARRLQRTMAAARVSFTWLGVRKALSPQQKEQAAEQFGAEGQFLSAAKKLIDTRHPAYKAVTAVRGRAIGYWRSVSLPYPEPGIRLIRQDRIDAFNERLSELKEELVENVARLDGHYAELKEAARRRLGSLYDEGDYPSGLQGLFELAWEFPSVEPPDYLLRLRPELYEQEKARITARFEEAVQMAEQAFAGEFTRLLAHLTERLGGEGQEKKVFRDTAVSNLGEFFARFKSLSVRSNPELDRLVDQAQGLIKGVAPQDLRNGEALRRRVAEQLSQVQRSLEGLIVDQPRRRILRGGAGPVAGAGQ